MSAMSLMRLLEKYNYLEFDVDMDVSHVSDEVVWRGVCVSHVQVPLCPPVIHCREIISCVDNGSTRKDFLPIYVHMHIES